MGIGAGGGPRLIRLMRLMRLLKLLKGQGFDGSSQLETILILARSGDNLVPGPDFARPEMAS